MNTPLRFTILCGVCLAALGQVAKEANSRYQTHEGREAVAKLLSAADRDSRQKPKELVDAMELRPGMVVADVGTGVGYMLPFLSKAVGPSGQVLAEDIFDDFLKAATDKAQKEKLTNVSFIKGTETSPNLPESSIDVILALDSYHHYDYPEKMLAGFHKGLRSGGRLIIVDFYKRPGAMPNGQAMTHIRLDEADVVKEIQARGFRLLSKREHIPGSQYMLVFEKG